MYAKSFFFFYIEGTKVAPFRIPPPRYSLAHLTKTADAKRPARAQLKSGAILHRLLAPGCHFSDESNALLQILVEYDDDDWETRAWINVYGDNFNLFAVEQTLVLATRSAGAANLRPALTFKPLVDIPGLFKGPKGSKLPVEFLSDLKLDFQDCNKLKVITVS